MRTFLSLSLTLLIATSGFGAVINRVGTYANWTTDWTAIPGLNDADNGADEELDFVGNASNPGAYWADNGTYVFFRFRVDVSGGEFADSHLLLIDVNNFLYGTGFGSDAPNTPDYAFMWDSKSADNTKHGLEMGVRNVTGSLWSNVKMNDLDGNSGVKGINDINGNLRTTDGYVRTTDGQATTNFSTTTLIDFAVSWSYLTTYTSLAKGQTWNIALASVSGATDHSAINGDVAGGASLTSSSTTGWATVAAIPEPTVVGLLSVSGIGILVGRRLIDPKLRKAIFG
jgi:hypothetical protein